MKVFYFLILIVLLSCQGNDRQTENYGDIHSGPGGKNLVIPEEHQGGWGRSECLLCHNSALNIHRNYNSSLDAEAINLKVIENGGAKYCLTCHGDNGVPQ